MLLRVQAEPVADRLMSDSPLFLPFHPPFGPSSSGSGGPPVSVLKAVSGEPREPTGDAGVSRVPRGPPLPSWSGDLAPSPNVQAWAPHRAPRDDGGAALAVPCGAPCRAVPSGGSCRAVLGGGACKGFLTPWRQPCPTCPSRGPPPPPNRGLQEAPAHLSLTTLFSPGGPCFQASLPGGRSSRPPQSLSVTHKTQLWSLPRTASSSPFPEEKG